LIPSSVDVVAEREGKGKVEGGSGDGFQRVGNDFDKVGGGEAE